MCLVKQVLDNPDCTSDDRFNILFEQLQNMEKKLDKDLAQMAPPAIAAFSAAADSNGGFKRPALPSLYADNNRNHHQKDELRRRAQKMKREHRRTRVIRTIPEIDANLVDITNNNFNNNNNNNNNNESEQDQQHHAKSNYFNDCDEAEEDQERDQENNRQVATMKKSSSNSRSASILNVTTCVDRSPQFKAFGNDAAYDELDEVAIGTPGDDKHKDPDWAKTPINRKRIKRTSGNNNKRATFSLKSSSLLDMNFE